MADPIIAKPIFDFTFNVPTMLLIAGGIWKAWRWLYHIKDQFDKLVRDFDTHQKDDVKQFAAVIARVERRRSPRRAVAAMSDYNENRGE